MRRRTLTQHNVPLSCAYNMSSIACVRYGARAAARRHGDAPYVVNHMSSTRRAVACYGAHATARRHSNAPFKDDGYSPECPFHRNHDAYLRPSCKLQRRLCHSPPNMAWSVGCDGRHCLSSPLITDEPQTCLGQPCVASHLSGVRDTGKAWYSLSLHDIALLLINLLQIDHLVENSAKLGYTVVLAHAIMLCMPSWWDPYMTDFSSSCKSEGISLSSFSVARISIFLQSNRQLERLEQKWSL